MFDITIKDNYLTDVEQVREFAIKYNNWRSSYLAVFIFLLLKNSAG